MAEDVLAFLSQVPDAELVARVKRLAAHERGTMAELVAYLAEIDRRRIYLRAGYGSLFIYCREALALAEHEAYNRIEVARAVRRFPVILEMLVAGSVNLTTVRLLAPHLTLDNHQLVLESARGKRKVEVEEIVARLAPRPDLPAFIRKLPPPRPILPASASLVVAAPVGGAPPPSPVASPKPAPILPLAPDRYKLQLTIGGATLERLRLAKDMLRHAVPSGDDAAILDRALAALLADLARKKFAATGAPRRSPGVEPGSRHIPAEVKRAVWVRDLGRCAFVGEGERRCGERGFLEFHHVRPYAVGGEATIENVQLRCRRHNDYEARTYFARDSPHDGGSQVPEGRGTRSGTSPPGAWPEARRNHVASSFLPPTPGPPRPT